MSEVGAIQRAARAGDLEGVKRILGGGVDIHDGEGECGTALHWAVAWGRDVVVDYLLDQGADVACRDDEGLTALHLAAKKGYTETRVLQRLLSANGCAVNLQCDAGMTALHHAAQRGRADFVALLIDAGAELGAKNEAGETALDLARRKNRFEVMELLTARGAR